MWNRAITELLLQKYGAVLFGGTIDLTSLESIKERRKVLEEVTAHKIGCSL